MPITFEQHPGDPSDHLDPHCNYCDRDAHVGLFHIIEGAKFWYSLCYKCYFFEKRQPVMEALIERQFATTIQ